MGGNGIPTKIMLLDYLPEKSILYDIFPWQVPKRIAPLMSFYDFIE